MKQIENDQAGNMRLQFSAKLISNLPETTLQNSNGKNYKVVNIEFTDVKGNVRQAGAAIYEGNYSHGVVKGETYLTTVTITEKANYIQMSHLTANAGSVETSAFLATTEVSSDVRKLVSEINS